MNKYLLLPLLLLTLLFSCSKDEKELFPDLRMEVTEKTLTVAVNAEKKFAVNIADGRTLTNEWLLDNVVVSKETGYTFKPTLAGDYTLVYKGSNHLGNFSYTYQINVPVPVTEPGANSSKYISKVFEYLPAPGQHINTTSYGTLEQAQKLVGASSTSSSLVSLGGFGGYIIFGFDHSVRNQEGADFGVYGNPSGGSYPFAEPGIVMVSQDKNGNGVPDDEWYELAGSEYSKATTIKNYEITYTNPKAYANVPWTDNQGKSGFVAVNTSYRQNYYPLFAANQEKITFKGTLLPSTTLNSTGIIFNRPFEWGYADSYSTGDDYATKGYNSFDLSWAVDKDGKKVTLNTVDFIKVYTAQNINAGFLGEISTDIKGAVDLGIK